MEPQANGTLIPAVEYVRMSTDHQRYSTANQSDAIRDYATQHGMTIVRTYSDAGNSAGGRWTHRIVSLLLQNEKYIGHNVWNRTSFKLQKKQLRNSPEMWLRADDAFEPIVDRQTFDAAQAIFVRRALYTCRGRRKGLSDDELLEALRKLGTERGSLSVALIDNTRGTPSSALYRKRFGGLKAAYQLIGYRPRRWHRGITRTGRPKGLSNDEMLESLRQLWVKQGNLTREIINKSKTVPSISAYYSQFGSLTRAYELIGFAPDPARLRARRSPRFASDEALLEGLGRLLRKRGRLSRRIIDEEKGFPARGTLAKRFGGLLKAFELVGYTPNMNQTRPNRSRDHGVR
jgi:hypothetical protein